MSHSIYNLETAGWSFRVTGAGSGPALLSNNLSQRLHLVRAPRYAGYGTRAIPGTTYEKKRYEL